MYLKSIFLGSIVALGAAVPGFSQDYGILQSLNACETLGVYGMTIDSEKSCLQLRGGVNYEFSAGQFRNDAAIADTPNPIKISTAGTAGADWDTRVNFWLHLIGTTETDYGPARAVIKLGTEDETRLRASPSGYTFSGTETDSKAGSTEITINEAFIEIGDATRLMVGKKGSIANLGNDQPFNFLSLFGASAYDGGGLGIGNDSKHLGGHSMQLLAKYSENLTLGAAIEALDKTQGDTISSQGGTVLATAAYDAEGISANAMAAVFNLNKADPNAWVIHSGVTKYFDGYKLRGAFAYRHNANDLGWNRMQALISAEANVKMVNIALSSEIAHNTNVATGDFVQFGFGGSVGMAFGEFVSGNLGGRFFHDGQSGLNTVQVAGQLNTQLTETLTLNTELGAYFGSKISDQRARGIFRNEAILYAAAEAGFAPGGGFRAALRGEANSEAAFKLTVRASKEFK